MRKPHTDKHADRVSQQQSFLPATFQPFYKGLITGQFNSVSIETFPLASNTEATANGSTVTPYSGFIGGTSGNGLTYFSGNYPLATQETNYLGGDVYNSEFSKILPGVALFTNNNGGIYRSSNIKSSDPNIVDVNVYSGVLSAIAPSSSGFSNSTYTSSGSPFKLWENYGQLKKIIHELKNMDKIADRVKYDLAGGDLMEKWANQFLQGERDLVSNRKDGRKQADDISSMTGERKNSHLKKHTKKASWLPPTNLVKSNSHKNSISSIKLGSLFEQEIEKIKKLITY